jgi:hypothetical protein
MGRIQAYLTDSALPGVCGEETSCKASEALADSLRTSIFRPKLSSVKFAAADTLG